MLGVLGCMRPLATDVVLEKFIYLADAENGRQHIPLLAKSASQISKHSNHILFHSENSFPKLIRGLLAISNPTKSQISQQRTKQVDQEITLTSKPKQAERVQRIAREDLM